MGQEKNIDSTKYPKQNPKRRVLVRFKDGTNTDFLGNIVRDDAEHPFKTIILLDDGRYVLSEECMFRDL
jgi:hypothetical protein